MELQMFKMYLGGGEGIHFPASLRRKPIKNFIKWPIKVVFFKCQL